MESLTIKIIVRDKHPPYPFKNALIKKKCTDKFFKSLILLFPLKIVCFNILSPQKVEYIDTTSDQYNMAMSFKIIKALFKSVIPLLGL